MDGERIGDRESAIYSARFPAAEHRSRDRIWQVLVEDFFQPMIRPGDTVLDLGCGFGEFIRHVRSARRIGVDVNTLAERTLAAHGVEFRHGSIGDLSFLAEGSVDFAFSSNVLEHLPDKRTVETVLHEVRRVLRPGGQLVLMGPNVRLVPGEYWDYWDHHVPISDRSLAEALRLARFSVVHQVPAFLPYTTKSRLPQAPWMVRWYLRIRWAWPFFGRQFLLRAER